MIKIYTDGACSGNPGPGGWGYVVVENGKLHSSNGSESQTTNNRMELTAAIKALESARKDESLYLYTDSTYLQKGITEWIVNWKKNNWRTASKKPVANKDLWIEISELSSVMAVNWHWVKGHDGDPGNERADYLANRGVDNVS